MTVSTAVAQSIDQYVPGQVFGYRDLPLYQSKPSNVVQIVNRLVKKNEIKRLSKGKFYKPKQSVIGDLKPSDSELLKTVMFKNGAVRGYITGTALFNQLGLTTQVPMLRAVGQSLPPAGLSLSRHRLIVNSGHVMSIPVTLSGSTIYRLDPMGYRPSTLWTAANTWLCLSVAMDCSHLIWKYRRPARASTWCLRCRSKSDSQLAAGPLEALSPARDSCVQKPHVLDKYPL